MHLLPHCNSNNSRCWMLRSRKKAKPQKVIGFWLDWRHVLVFLSKMACCASLLRSPYSLKKCSPCVGWQFTTNDQVSTTTLPEVFGGGVALCVVRLYGFAQKFRPLKLPWDSYRRSVRLSFETKEVWIIQVKREKFWPLSFWFVLFGSDSQTRFFFEIFPRNVFDNWAGP